MPADSLVPDPVAELDKFRDLTRKRHEMWADWLAVDAVELAGVTEELIRCGARLAAAVEAALEHHEPVDDGRWHTTVCGRCRETWPCGEVQDITAALLGKEDTDAT